MDKSIGQVVFGVLLLLAAVAAFIHAGTLPSGHATNTLPPSFFPRAISALVAVLALYCLIRELRATQWREFSRGLPSIGVGGSIGVALFVLMAGYATLFERLGYIVSTALFVTLCVVLLSVGARYGGTGESIPGVRQWLGLIALSLAFAAGVFYVFLWGFSIALPTLR